MCPVGIKDICRLPVTWLSVYACWKCGIWSITYNHTKHYFIKSLEIQFAVCAKATILEWLKGMLKLHCTSNTCDKNNDNVLSKEYCKTWQCIYWMGSCLLPPKLLYTGGKISWVNFPINLCKSRALADKLKVVRPNLVKWPIQVVPGNFKKSL